MAYTVIRYQALGFGYWCLVSALPLAAEAASWIGKETL
jgi:hypothetical protein